MAFLSNFIIALRLHLLMTSIGGGALICLCVVLYRLTFHPLAKIPGPRLAAATQWYEFYYDVIRKGDYTRRIAEIHEQYGPIIRISPNELHCSDPAFIDQIYAGSGSGKKRDKTPFYCRGMQLYGSCIHTIHHDHHRFRRSVLNQCFSKASVTKLEPTIMQYANEICQQIETYAGTNKPCNLTYAFSGMTTDVVTEYCFGFNHKYSSNKTFVPNMVQPLHALMHPVILSKHCPWLLPVLNNLPDWIVEKAIPEVVEWSRMAKTIAGIVDTVLSSGTKKPVNSTSGTTIFSAILDSELPSEEKSRQRLFNEAVELIGAGTETTAWTLSVAMYYILSQPQTLEKLSAELRQCFKDPSRIPSWSSLERLPYLISFPLFCQQLQRGLISSHSATIAEGLRLSYGVSTRLQRVPHEPLYYSSIFDGRHISMTIPAGTAIGMTNYLVHHDASIFPNSNKFIPERWLNQQGARSRDLDGYLLTFSKGSRQCLGINLAYAELFIGLAMVVHRFGMRLELYQTGPAEIEYTYDLYGPGKESYEGVRVLVN